MDFLKTTILRFGKEVIIGVEAVAIIVLAILLQKKEVKVINNLDDITTPIVEEIAVIKEPKMIKVDIKGAVVNPGVYEALDTSNVSDIIALAGGLKKNADTSNLNLSRRITDQMVIKVYTSSELKTLNSVKEDTDSCVVETVVIDSCKDSSIIETEQTSGTNSSTTSDNNVSQNTQTNNSLISINTATLEQLMSLSGIGESKAKSIIEYRQTVGYFTKIEDIMNVSGIGESVFNKIKDYITV